VSEVVALLESLVRTPSANPMGQPLRPETDGERRLTDCLEARLKSLGVRLDRIEIAPGRDNLLAYWSPPRARRWILWDAHQDTVPADGMAIEPFGAKIENGRLYGRGACDVKGGLAAMVVAFETLVRESPSSCAGVVLALTVDEEFTHIGSSALASMALPADLAIVAEPTKLDLVSTHKGSARWRISTHGTACHSSTPELGRNAIYLMAKVVDTLKSLADGLSAGPQFPKLGPATLSVGRISGGQGVNVVPDLCMIEVDRRLIPGESPESALAQVKVCLERKLGTLDGLTFEPMNVGMSPLEPRLDARDIKSMLGAIRHVTGRAPSVLGVPYGTDAGPLSEAGIPCVVLGPGDIAQAHTRDEWIELNQLHEAVDVYIEIAKALA
jgi:acetylornithine deacetylase